MNKTIDFQGRKVHYSVDGKGEALVFLHGYLESSAIWTSFVERFTNNYKVICVDLPGHGESEVIAQIHSMQMLAEVVNEVLIAENITKLTVIGHSMGGYVTMELVSMIPEKILGYCLFHSTCFADNEEKKANRNREISLVKCGKKMQIIHTNIPKAFAEANLDRLNDQIVEAKIIAANSPNEGIIALLRGMKERNDHSARLADPSIKPMLIWGKQDNYIAEETFSLLKDLAPHAALLVLKDSGHMGFIEEADAAFSGLVQYLNSQV